MTSASTSYTGPRIMVLDRASISSRPDWPGFSFPTVVFDPRKESPYRLYLGSHSSKELLVAVSDSIEGPWQVQSDPLISLSEVPGARWHLGSPEVKINTAGDCELMFHASTRFHGQRTFAAKSRDGLKFTAKRGFGKRLPFYARLFQIGKHSFAMTKGGDIFKKGLFGGFAPVNNPFVGDLYYGTRHNYVGAVRHVSLLSIEGGLFVFFTKIGDAPERILCARLTHEYSQGKTTFRVGKAMDIAAPNLPWEGSTLPIHPSAKGESKFEENALRDPFAFLENESGLIHIFYVAAGESRIGKTTIAVTDFLAIMSSVDSTRLKDQLPLVCVLGFSHAGTTVMYRMLSRSPGAGSFPFETKQFLSGVTPPLGDLLVDRGRYINPPVILVEKTPGHVLRIPEILNSLPGTRFVLMIRDMGDLAGSLYRRLGNWRKVLSRLDGVANCLSEYRDLEEVLVVRYEDLIEAPETVIRKIARHTNLEWADEMLRFHESKQSWQGYELPPGGNSELPLSTENPKRRAHQVARPLYNAIGEGRGCLTSSQIQRIEKRYQKYQRDNGYGSTSTDHGMTKQS